MSTLPKAVLLREYGPREGFQMLPQVVPTSQKLELIHALATTGIRSIEVTSFVRPDLLPQLADAEAIAAGLPLTTQVKFEALYLNAKGLARACACPQLRPEGCVNIAVSETFLKGNSNTTLDQAIASLPEWITLFQKHGLTFDRLMISTAWGYHAEGRFSTTQTLDVVRRALTAIEQAGGAVAEITFADTTGYANPRSVAELIEAARMAWPKHELGLHLHDTRGTGMANVLAGLQTGVTRFDCSVGGLGGCPFAKNAAGNVPTEDVAFMCAEMGIETGIDLERYIDCAKLAERIAGRSLPGKVKDGGILRST